VGKNNMNRELREELRPDEVEGLEQVAQANENSIQIPLTEEQEKELVDIVIQDFDTAVEARNQKIYGTNTKGDELDWEGKYKLIIQKYEGHTEKPLKTWMSSGTTRISTAIIETIHAKLFPAVWNENLINWKPVEATDIETVKRINKLMPWVIKVRMKMRRVVDDIIKYTCKMGTCITKVSWEVSKKDIGNVEPIISQDEMGNPMPVMDETGNPITQKVLDIKEKPKLEIVPLDRFYIQPGQFDINKEPVIERIAYYYSDLEQLQLQGRLKNVNEKLKPQVDQEIVSKLSKELSEAERISICNVKRRVYPMDVLEWYGSYDYDNDGFMEDCVVDIEYKTKTLISAIPLHKIQKKGLRPYDKHDLIPRELKFYAIGLIELVMPLAEEADACLRQIRDANTIGIQRFGFYDASGDYNPETHTIAPLKMYPVTDPQRSVYFPDISVPIESLIATLRVVFDLIERLTAASSYIMGKESDIVGGSGTATRTQAIVMNAEQRFDLPAQRLRETLSQTLTKILHQVQMNLPAGMEREVLGEKGEPIFQENELVKERIAAELDAYIEGDPGMGDKNTERQIAGFVYSTLLQNPIVMSDPAKIYNATSDLLETYGKNVETYLGPRPSMLDFDSPQDENTLIREGRFKDVEPKITENHVEHILIHSLPLQTMEKEQWTPLSLQYLQQHIMAHQQMMSQMIQMTAGMKKQNPNAPAGVNPGGTPNPMENAPGSDNNAAQMGGQTLNG